MSSPLTQIKEVWGRLPLGGRISVIAAGVGTLALIGLMVYFSSQPEYGVLFSDLKPSDASGIVEKLKAANVPYALSNNGTTVSIPQDKISETRLQMAGSGALSGGHVGFDLFDKTSFGATDFTQQVNYRRALEGELAKTLEGMEEVESVRVHITPKKESIFTEKEEGAKASVMLRVRNGREISSERTDAVVSLVASSIEGLDPANISVLDTRGRLLTAAGRNKGGAYNDAGIFNAQLESKQKYEAETAARIITLLEPIAGENRVRADVSADVDFSQVEQTEEKYNPQSQVVRSQQTSQELRNSPKGTGAIVGARANDPTTQASPTPQPTQPAASADQRNSTTVNYEIDKTVRRTVGGGGRINRLSVSVVLDHKTVSGVQTARTPDEIKQVQELVAAAVGTDEKRGDAVVVQTMPFDKPQLETTTPTLADSYKQYLPALIKYGALLLIAILIFLFVIRPARRALKAAATPAEEPKLLGTGATAASVDEDGERLFNPIERRGNQLENGIPASLTGAMNGEAVNQLQPMKTVAQMEAEMSDEIIAQETAAAYTPDVQRLNAIKKHLTEQIMREPETFSSTIRGWIKEMPK